MRWRRRRAATATFNEFDFGRPNLPRLSSFDRSCRPAVAEHQRHFVLSLPMLVAYLVSTDENSQLPRRKLAVVNTTSAVQSVEVRSSPFYPRRSEICRSIAVRELVHHAETLEMRHSRVRWVFATETSRRSFSRQLPRACDRVANINSVGLYRVCHQPSVQPVRIRLIRAKSTESHLSKRFSIVRSLGTGLFLLKI